MQDKSNSFLQVTPFIPRSGILGSSYIAFPLDTIAGCIEVSPNENFEASNEGDQFVIDPISKQYVIENTGSYPISWIAESSQPWMDISQESGVLNPHESVTITISFNSQAYELPGSDDPYVASIGIINTTNNCGSVSFSVLLTIHACSPVFTDECRTRGGIAELCGNSEFANASVPPKKYRTKTLQGVSGNVVYSAGNTTCNNAAVGTYCNVTMTWSGVNSWNKDTCAYTQGGVRDRSGTCGGNGPVSVSDVTDFPPDGSYTIADKTSSASQCDGVCIVTNFGTGSIICQTPATARMDLTDEDTESDALDRLLAAEDWTAWAPASECRAAYQERVSGFQFEFVSAQRRITGTGMTPGETMTVTAPIYRRVYGVGSYELYQTLTITEDADGSGEAVVEFDVPNDIGYETFAGEPEVTISCLQE